MVLPAKRPPQSRPGMDTERVKADERIGWRLMGMGVQISSEVIAGAGLGWLVDYFMHNEQHWGVLIGGCAGIAVGLTTLLRTAWKINRELDGARRGASPSRKGQQ